MTDILSKIRIQLQDHGMEYFKRYYAPTRGIVYSNEDPEVLGRLRLKCPAVYGSAVPDRWAWPKGMYAGKNIGFYAIPNPGDMVWVTFENGDARYPIWEYGHWSLNHKTPDTVKGPKQKVFQTTSGMRLVYDDEAKKIVIWKKEGRVIELNEKNISLGSEDHSGYAGVLGEILEDVLEELRGDFGDHLDELIKYATTQSAAATSVGILSPMVAGYSTLLTALVDLKIQLIKLQKKIPDIKSKIITLD